MMVKLHLRRLLLASLLVALALVVSTCEGNRSAIPVSESQAEAGTSPTLDQQQPLGVSLDDVLAEINGLEAPDGVDTGLFEEISSAFGDTLRARGVSEFVAHPPVGQANRVDDLLLTDNGDGSYTLSWGYKNVGDYDLNGEVNAADITQIAVHFGTRTGDDSWSDAQLADGDGNGEVNISDVTPIAINYLAYVAGYSILGSDSPVGNRNVLGTLDLSDGQISPRLKFQHVLTSIIYPYYVVVPFDSSGDNGVESSLANALPLQIVYPLTISPSGLIIDTPADILFNITLDPQFGEPITCEVVEINESGEIIANLGTLVDDGSPASGDVLAGDSTYCLTVNANSPIEQNKTYQAQLTFDNGGVEEAIMSNIVILQFYAAMSEERAQELLDHVNQVTGQLSLLVQTLPVEEAAAQLADTLTNTNGIEMAGIVGSGRGVWWVTDDNICCLATHTSGNSSSSSTSGIVHEQDGFMRFDPTSNEIVSAIPRQTSQTQSRPISERTVLAIAAFRDEFDNDDLGITDDVPVLYEMFEDSECPDYDEVLYVNEECTVDVFRGIGSYGIVLISSHGDTFLDHPTKSGWLPEWPFFGWMIGGDKGSQVAVLTRETCTIPNLIDNLDDLRAGRLVISGDTWYGSDSHLAITPAFITYYCHDMRDCLVYLSSCRGAHNDTIVRALLSEQTSVIFSYSEVVSPIYTYQQSIPFFTSLLEGKNTDEAYLSCPAGVDPAPPGAYDPAYKVMYSIDTLDLNGKYNVTNLSIFPFTNSSEATDINDNGVVVGNCDNQAFIWRSEETGLEHLDETVFMNSAKAVNNSNQVVGWVRPSSDPNDFVRAMVWQESTGTTDLWVLIKSLTNDVCEFFDYPRDINDNGLIAGNADFDYPPPEAPNVDGRRAIVFNINSNSLIDLGRCGVLPGSPGASEAWGLNSKDHAVGIDEKTAFIWKGSTMTALPATADHYNLALAINAAGYAVGFCTQDSFDNRIAVYWPPDFSDPIQLHGIELDHNWVGALDVDSKGNVVGYSGTKDGVIDFNAVLWPERAANWWGSSSPILNLNCEIPKDSDWDLREARAINENGQIVGYGYFNNNRRAFLLTPRNMN